MAAPFISDSAVSDLLTYPELAAALERAFSAFSAGPSPAVQQPQRGQVRTADQSNLFYVMPAYMEEEAAFITKIISFFPGNTGTEIPSHQGIVLLFDGRNGCLLATISAEELTARRTAAASAVASKHMASQGATCLAVLGAGTQADSHVTAHLELFPGLKKVHMWSRTRGSAERLMEQLQKKNPSISFRVFDCARDAVQDAHIVCTVTSSATPVLDSTWLLPNAHVNAVGACRAEWRELEINVLQDSFIVADSRIAAQVESGDIRAVDGRVDAELGDVVSGRVTVDRESKTVFKSLGMALEDLVSAKLVFAAMKKAEKE